MGFYYFSLLKEVKLTEGMVYNVSRALHSACTRPAGSGQYLHLIAH